MNSVMSKGRIRERSPRVEARVVYGYYLLTLVTGIVVLLVGSRLNFLVDVIATAFFVAVTALFYALTKRE